MTEPTTPGSQVTAAQLLAFLDGSGQIDGVGFGDRHPTLPGAFWWRSFLPLLAQPPARQALDSLREMVERFEPNAWGSSDNRRDALENARAAIAALSATQETS